MPRYPLTVVLLLHASGDTADDIEKVRVSARAVADKVARKDNRTVPSFEFTLGMTEATPRPPPELKGLMARLRSESGRLYIFGHGDWKNQTLAGWMAGSVADLLEERLGFEGAETISLASCGVAADYSAADGVRKHHSVDSFAAWFTHHLTKPVAEVHARYFNVEVTSDIRRRIAEAADGSVVQERFQGQNHGDKHQMTPGKMVAPWKTVIFRKKDGQVRRISELLQGGQREVDLFDPEEAAAAFRARWAK